MVQGRIGFERGKGAHAKTRGRENRGCGVANSEEGVTQGATRGIEIKGKEGLTQRREE